MQRQSLNGAWQVRQEATDQSYPALVPGCIHTDLLAAEVIPDPFYRDNELLQTWVGETDWTYSRSFHITDELLAHPAVYLRCDGLDTIATIRVNGDELGTAQNMFRTYEYDVKAYLVTGENHIEVAFRAPMEYVRHMDAVHGEMAGWVEPMRVNSGGWIRKEPCNFGWDWGPKLPTVGIWRDIELIAFERARLTDVLILQEHVAAAVNLTIKLAVEQIEQSQLKAHITITLAGVKVAEVPDLVFENNRISAQLGIDEPQLWWINGLGEQPLYNVQVTLFTANDELLDTVEKRIGLRVLQLETPNDEWGQGMFFTCNGVPFFAKGANWIPASPYPAEPTRDDLEVFVAAAAAANMNMLRVWGGGIYEDDAFYDLCDAYGIAVWQDFMFACGTYPSHNADWMENVRQEAIQNVQRIRHHASLAVWCGNNEIEQGMMEAAWANTIGWNDYNKLFVDLLGEVVQEHDPQRRYWQSSPHSPNNVHDPFDQTVGDTHLWAVWHGKEPFEWYRTRQDRFCSEFGFQSFPQPTTVYEFTSPQDRNITSYVMEHHQRSAIGNSTIIHYMLDWYQLPTGFENTIWLSQILQGMAMKYAVEHWRRNMPRTMGTLYWQLNDIWGGPSWASLDWRGHWKALHYMARRFNEPLLISAIENVDTGTVDVHVTSDRLEDIPATVTYTVTNVNGDEIEMNALDVTIHANTNTFVTKLDFAALLKSYTARNLMIWLELSVEQLVVSDNLVLFTRPKHLPLPDPQLRTSIQQISECEFDIHITAQATALYAWLSFADGRFSDNFVDLRPRQPYSIRLTTPEPMSAEQVLDVLEVRSLYDTYQPCAH